MTRIWYVPFSELDDRRVLGQHREVHIIHGLVSAGKRWKGFSVPHLAAVHRAAVKEMKIRGFNSGIFHETPLPVGPQEGQEDLEWPGDSLAYQLLAEQDRWDLLCRWQGIYKGRCFMPDEYEPLIARYIREGGCTHAGRTATLADGSIQCLTCKQAILVNGMWVPDKWRE